MNRYFILLIVLLISAPAFAAGSAKPNRQVDWHFDGPFGTFDDASIQRGYQVYKEVCAACHGLKRIAYRNLKEVGFSEAEVKAIAADALVIDGPNDDGDMFERPGRPSDRFVSPFPNKKAAMAANGGAYPLDLSLITKARVDGPNYVYSLLTGYKDAPADFDLTDGLYYNPYFPGGQIAMAPPIQEGLIEYIDGTEASKDQMAKDVVNFLQWAAEPEMEQRKSMGTKVMFFLLFVFVLFIFANRRTWEDVKK